MKRILDGLGSSVRILDTTKSSTRFPLPCVSPQWMWSLTDGAQAKELLAWVEEADFPLAWYKKCLVGGLASLNKLASSGSPLPSLAPR